MSGTGLSASRSRQHGYRHLSGVENTNSLNNLRCACAHRAYLAFFPMSELSRQPPQSSFDEPDEVDLHDLGSALWRGRWLVAAFTVAALGIGMLVVWLQPPVYESQAMVRVVPEEKGFDLGASSSSSMRLLLGLENSGDLQTSVGILESRRIAEAIMDSLALHVVLRSPATPRDRVLQVIEAPRTTRKATVDLRRVSGSSYSITSSGLPAANREVVPIGEPVRVGGLVLRLNPELRHNPPERIRLQLRPYQRTVRRLQRRLAVTQPAAGSQLVKLRYRHQDSLLVAAVPNIAAERFIEYKNLTSSSESYSILGFLQEQATEYRQDLRESEERLQVFLEQAQVIEPRTEAEEQARRLAVLQAERESLQTERETLAALLRQIEATPRSADQPSPYRQLVAFPSFLANSMVQYILQSIIALENERSALLIRRLERDPDVAGQTARIQELEQQLHQVARNYLNDRDRRLAALDVNLGRFAGQVARLPAREVELRRLMRETELLEEVYQMIETKLKEEEIRAAAQLANIQIVDHAVIPDEPEFPKPWLYLTLSGILGLFVGSGVAVVRARANATVDSRGDVFAATAGLPVLAAINLSPQLTADRNGRRKLLPAVIEGRNLPVRVGAVWPSRRPGADTGKASTTPLISFVDPADRLGDSYRELRTNVGAPGGAGEARVLVLAGADHGDDSALTAANLAIAYAQQGTRVLLIDADLRAGSLHTLFEVSKEPGLSDALLSPDSLPELVRELAVGGSGTPLHLLCSGSPKQNPADLVGSEAMRSLASQVRGSYEQVIIATPPVNAAPDASLLARLADRALLVVTARTTTRTALASATRQLQHLRAPVEGVVVNGFV
jgi:polysaccharide biosynthesis transport protein